MREWVWLDRVGRFSARSRWSGAAFPQVPDRPTRDAAAAAMAELKDLVGTLPFVGEPDRAVALSTVLMLDALRARYPCSVPADQPQLRLPEGRRHA